MHSFVQRLASSRKMLWGGLALLGALTLPVSSSFAQEYYEPAYGYADPGYQGYQGAPVPVPAPAPPVVVYAPDYRRPEWRWRWRQWHRHHAPYYYEHHHRGWRR